MKFKKIDLLTLLIGLFLFVSCKDNSTIGLDIDPAIAIKGNLVDTLTINSRTIAEEIAPTNTAIRHPLGYLNDPIFGTTESSLALTINLPEEESVDYDFGTSPVLDSAVLVLSFSSQFYGDTAASVYSIDVKRLSDDISNYESFLTSRTYASDPALLGNRTGKIYPNTKLKVLDVIEGREDTLKTVVPQIRIKLDPTFVQNNILNLDATALKTNNSFTSAVRGFKVSLNKPASTGNLGIMFFDFAGANSNLELHYKKEKDGGGKDTVSVNFPISKSRGRVAASISHDYTGTPIATQLSNPGTQYPETYLSGLAGVRTKLTFPYLKDFGTKVGKIALNKAELVIDLSSGTDAFPFAAAERFAMFRYDIAHKRQDISDRVFFQALFNNEAFGNASFGGYYNPHKKQYVFVVTNYIQALINGQDEDYGTFISITPTTELDNLTPSVASAARSVIGSGAKDASGSLINPHNKIKLNLYYTKIN